MPGDRRRTGSDDVADRVPRREMAFDVSPAWASPWCRDDENPAANNEKERRRYDRHALRSLAPHLTSEKSRPLHPSRPIDCPRTFPHGREKSPACRVGSGGYLTVFTCETRHKACPCAMRFDQMQRTSMPTGPRPVVLLVQPSRDDGLEVYTEFLRCHGLAVIRSWIRGMPSCWRPRPTSWSRG